MVGMCVVACGSSDSGPNLSTETSANPTTPGAAGGGGSGSGSGAQGSDPNGVAPPDGCGPAVCTDWNERAACTATAGSPVWTKTTCAAGEGCVRGACVAGSCSDSCGLGEAGCGLRDAASGATATLDTGKTHDRARAFEKWIRSDTSSLFQGQIVSVKYTSAARSQVSSIYIGDSALHTGLYLGGEAHRLLATGSFDARKNVRSLVDFVHVLFNISGDPGMMATSAFPAGDPDLRAWTTWNCADFDRHCDVSYGGKKWDYVGQPSRDMYMGPLFGLVAAYDALGAFDEDRRELIRHDLVTWANELVKKRTLPVRLVLNGLKLPVENKEARFFIPETADMVDGAIQIELSASNAGSGQVRGGRDFMPNPSLLFRQFAALSSLPDIPRSSAALMVGGVIQAALHATEGAPKYAVDRTALRAFYDSNSDAWGKAKDWIGVAASAGGTQHSCTAAYFGLGLAWLAGYTWGLLEQEPTTRADLFTRVIDGKMWPDAQGHKNSVFTFQYGAMKKGAFSGMPLTDAVRQITDFPAPPRVAVPKSGDCSPDAVEIGDRPVTYLTWHANPWSRSDSGNLAKTFPGHDYVEGYWLGRSSGFVDDDTPKTCLHP